MNFFPDFAPNSRKEWRLLLFQSNLRKQIRKLPKILNFLKIIHYYSKLFTSPLILGPSAPHFDRRAKFEKIVTCVAFSIKFAKTNQKFAENSEFCEKNSLLLKVFKIIHFTPYSQRTELGPANSSSGWTRYMRARPRRRMEISCGVQV